MNRIDYKMYMHALRCSCHVQLHYRTLQGLQRHRLSRAEDGRTRSHVPSTTRPVGRPAAARAPEQAGALAHALPLTNSKTAPFWANCLTHATHTTHTIIQSTEGAKRKSNRSIPGPARPLTHTRST